MNLLAFAVFLGCQESVLFANPSKFVNNILAFYRTVYGLTPWRAFATVAMMTNRRELQQDGGSWDDICKRCGRCCYEKVEYAGEVFYTDVPCDRLDPVTRLCTVYSDRHRVRPGCVQLTPEIIRRGVLPADCPYVQGVAGYRAPHLWPNDGDEGDVAATTF